MMVGWSNLGRHLRLGWAARGVAGGGGGAAELRRAGGEG
jgi:hypothetical protein